MGIRSRSSNRPLPGPRASFALRRPNAAPVGRPAVHEASESATDYHLIADVRSVARRESVFLERVTTGFPMPGGGERDGWFAVVGGTVHWREVELLGIGEILSHVVVGDHVER